MALLKIFSNSENFSWAIYKNPHSGISTRPIRQGLGIGWFSDNNQYNLFFKDGEDANSFSKENFEYLSQSKFSSPLVYLSLLSEFLRSTIKEVSEYDTKAGQQIVLEYVTTKSSRVLKQLKAHLNIDMTYEVIDIDTYRISFYDPNTTLNEIINMAMLSCLFLSGKEGSYIAKINDAFLIKYINIINKLELPYFLRYIFARNYLQDKNKFNEHKELLEGDNISLCNGSVNFQRLRFIEKYLSNDRSILDIGCGEGLYVFNLTRKNKFTYHAIDIKSDVINVIDKKAEIRQLDVKTYTDIEQYKNESQVDILLTEVIEHMSVIEAEDLINKVLKLNFHQIFITTPNKDFNKNYLLSSEEMRDDDHKWEMSSNRFRYWINSVLNSDNNSYTYEFVNIGDSVNNEYTTHGLIITNMNIKPQVIITIGCSASGKSTFAEAFCRKRPYKWVEINRDNIRFKGVEKNWNNYKFTKRNESAVTNEWNKQLDKAIKDKWNVVLSDTNLNEHYRNKLIEKLKDRGYEIVIKAFPVEFEELLKRDRQRLGGVGYEVLLKQYINYQRQYVRKYEPIEGNVKVYIVDIDGTLALNKHRVIFDYSKVLTDIPNEHVINIINGLKYLNDYKIIFLSGRDDSCRVDTLEWLQSFVNPTIRNEDLFMRKTGDVRKDYFIKTELFDNHIRYKYDVLAAIDDRKQVIECCWNVLGVNVINVGNAAERF